MSKRHPLDELFKQHLQNASAPVPDQMWERIAHARREKKRRGLMLVWSAVGATTLGLLAFLLWPASAPEIEHFPLAGDAPAEVVASTNAADRPTGTESMIHHPAEETSRAALPAAGANAATRPTASPATVPTTIERPAMKGTGRLVPNRPRTTLQETPADAAPTSAPMPATTETPSESPKIAGPHQRSRATATAQLLPSLDLVPTAATPLDLFAGHAPRCARFANPFFRFDLEVMAGPAYAHQQLAAKTPESVDHLTRRQNSEAANLSYTAGFRLAASSSVGLRLRSGLMFAQINERFTFNAGSRMIVETIFNPSGQPIGYDTTLIENYREVHRNRLSFVELPLLLGYERRVGKFRMGLNAGAFLNLHFGARGKVASPADGEPIAIGQEGERNVLPIFEQRTTAAWYAGMSVAYNLHSRYSLVAEPYFKTYPRPLSNKAYDLRQNYWMTGLQLGMRVRL